VTVMYGKRELTSVTNRVATVYFRTPLAVMARNAIVVTSKRQMVG